MRLVKLGQGDYTRETDSFGPGAWVLAALFLLFVLLVLTGE